MTLLPFLRSLPHLLRRPAPAVTQAPRTQSEHKVPAAALQRVPPSPDLARLYSLCEEIEQGYQSGKCMYDSGMTSLAETLTSSTGEIKYLIEQCARMRTVLAGLGDYDVYEITYTECDDVYQDLKREAAAIVAESKGKVLHA